MQKTPSLIPLTLITGFLGSGKTTLLNYLLRQPELAETLVLINEFGEVGLDHLLVKHLTEHVVLLDSGCMCCNVRGDVASSLMEAIGEADDKSLPMPRRVMIETTGLADPAPILQTLMSHPFLLARFRIDGVVTVVDARHGRATLAAQPESVKQVAVADVVLLSKLDQTDAEEVTALRAMLQALNPGAPQIDISHGEVPVAAVLGLGLFDPGKKSPDVAQWLKAEAYRAVPVRPLLGAKIAPLTERHRSDVQSACYIFDQPLDWTMLSSALDMLLTFRGEQVLRIKGILHLQGEDLPYALHGVQQLLYPLAKLPAWPDEDRRSKLVIISRGLSEAWLSGVFANFLANAG